MPTCKCLPISPKHACFDFSSTPHTGNQEIKWLYSALWMSLSQHLSAESLISAQTQLLHRFPTTQHFPHWRALPTPVFWLFFSSANFLQKGRLSLSSYFPNETHGKDQQVKRPFCRFLFFGPLPMVLCSSLAWPHTQRMLFLYNFNMFYTGKPDAVFLCVSSEMFTIAQVPKHGMYKRAKKRYCLDHPGTREVTLDQDDRPDQS